MANRAAEEVIDFWFSDRDETGAFVFRKEWFEKDPAFYAVISQKFGALYEKAAARDLDDWSANPRSALALILVLDQFSRNMFRGDPAMYAADEYAVEVATGAIDQDHHMVFPLLQRWFFFMPMMHSENLVHQDACVRLFEELPDGDVVARGREAAQQHRDIVARFGRFPRRNAILGRSTTDDEAAFLLEPNSSF